jgi:UDP-2,3-diacylglucosamine pyrophosphatase LpxH
MSEITRKVFIISDLHLGGEAGPGKRSFRICTHETVLAGFIDWLTAMQGSAIELVINGDVVDFLAEKSDDNEPWSAFRFPERKAVDCLDIIVKRSALVFDALKRFLATGHRLVILPGNHDIELNLPAVRRRLGEHVGAGRGGDYEFIAHGEAYRVGDVLIEHGNRVDDMNFVDYHSLRHLCGLVSRGMAVRDEFLFDPPPGSKLVAEVINKIKKDYSFIDLLKPEAEAALPVILALEPGRSGELLKIAKALAAAKFRRRQQLRDYNSNIRQWRLNPLPWAQRRRSHFSARPAVSHRCFWEPGMRRGNAVFTICSMPCALSKTPIRSTGRLRRKPLTSRKLRISHTAQSVTWYSDIRIWRSKSRCQEAASISIAEPGRTCLCCPVISSTLQGNLLHWQSWNILSAAYV